MNSKIDIQPFESSNLKSRCPSMRTLTTADEWQDHKQSLEQDKLDEKADLLSPFT